MFSMHRTRLASHNAHHQRHTQRTNTSRRTHQESLPNFIPQNSDVSIAGGRTERRPRCDSHRCVAVTLVPRTPPPGCTTCDDKSKPSQLTVTWACQGPPPASIGNAKDLSSYDAVTGVAVFGSGGDKLGGDLRLEYNGIENEIHVSCSSELGPGLRTSTESEDKKCQDSCTCSGCFVITGIVSEGGGEFCPFCNEEFLAQAAAGLPIG